MSNFNDANVPAVVDQNKVNNIIKVATGASGVAALIPIPFADIGPITAAQIVMVTAIFKEYERPIQEGLIAKVIPPLVLTQLGKSVAGSLMKMIPGIGSVAGGAVRVGVASTFTVGLGIAAKMYCEKVETDSDFAQMVKGLDIMSLGAQYKALFTTSDEQKAEG